MSVLQAFQHASVRVVAWALLQAGLSIIPLSGKKAAVKWTPFQERLAIYEQFSQWDKSNYLQNVGIVCGKVSGNLVVIDLDGSGAIRLFENTFPDLLDTLTVATGSGRGKHLYFFSEALPDTKRVSAIPNVGNIELRANGCYVVAPPSIHPETKKPYTIERAVEVMKLPDMNQLKSWLSDMLRRPLPTSPAVRKDSGKRAIWIGYARAALVGEANAVRNTAQGKRNNRLNLAAYNLGQLVGDGLISRSEVEHELLAAYMDVYTPDAENNRSHTSHEREGRTTIKSGLEAGIRNPRSRRYAQ